MFSIRQYISGTLCLSLFLTNSVLAHALETHVWNERRRFTTPATLPSSVSALPAVQPTLFQTKGLFQCVRHPLSGPSANQVIIIQDVHAHEEAQRNIADFIHKLSHNETLDYLALEGRSEPISLEKYRTGPPNELESAANYLLQIGKISGAIYAGLMMDKRPPQIVGIEKQSLYEKNVTAYKTVALRTKALSDYYSRQEEQITRSGQKVLNPRLAAFDTFARRHQSRSGDVIAYLEQLSRLRSLSPVLTQYRRAVAMEAKINWSRVERERQDLQTLSREDVPTDFKKYPALQKLQEYLQVVGNLDRRVFFREVERQEVETYQQLALSAQEQQTVNEIRLMRLMCKLVSFSLTADEWETYQQLKRRTTVAQMDGVDACEKFYFYATERNDAMAERIIGQFGGSTPRTGVVVVGGFHAEAIEAKLNAAGFSTQIFTPRLSQITGTETGVDYLRVFAQQKTPLEQWAANEQSFLANDAGLGLPMLPYLRQLVHRAQSMLLSRSQVTVKMVFSWKSQAVRVAAQIVRNPKNPLAPRIVAVASAGVPSAPEQFDLPLLFRGLLIAGLVIVVYRIVRVWLPSARSNATSQLGPTTTHIIIPDPNPALESELPGVPTNGEVTKPMAQSPDSAVTADVALRTDSGQIHRIFYKVPLESDPNISALRRFRFRYNKNDRRLNRWTQTRLEPSETSEEEVLISRISYDLIFWGERMMALIERPNNTMIGSFHVNNDPGYAYQLVIAKKPRLGLEQEGEMKAWVDIRKPEDGFIRIEIYSEFAREVVNGRRKYFVKPGSKPKVVRLKQVADISIQLRNIFNVAEKIMRSATEEPPVSSSPAESKPLASENVYFGDFDSSHRPGWAAYTMLTKGIVHGQITEAVRSVMFYSYDEDGRCTETVFNLTNGRAGASTWSERLMELSRSQMETRFHLEGRQWNQQSRYAPSTDPVNPMVRVLEETLIQKLDQKGNVIGRKKETVTAVVGPKFTENTTETLEEEDEATPEVEIPDLPATPEPIVPNVNVKAALEGILLLGSAALFYAIAPWVVPSQWRLTGALMAAMALTGALYFIRRWSKGVALLLAALFLSTPAPSQTPTASSLFPPVATKEDSLLPDLVDVGLERRLRTSRRSKEGA